MAWCCQATSHYLSQCWPRSMWPYVVIMTQWVNTSRQTQTGRHCADDIFKCIFLNENIWIVIKFSRKFIPKGPVNNIPALVQIMAWHHLGDQPLSEPMIVSLPTPIFVNQCQWVNTGGLNKMAGILQTIWKSEIWFLCYKLEKNLNVLKVYLMLSQHWVQVMAWCHWNIATSQYLKQYWTNSIMLYDIARSQWVKLVTFHKGNSFTDTISLWNKYWIRLLTLTWNVYNWDMNYFPFFNELPPLVYWQVLIIDGFIVVMASWDNSTITLLRFCSSVIPIWCQYNQESCGSALGCATPNAALYHT